MGGCMSKNSVVPLNTSTSTGGLVNSPISKSSLVTTSEFSTARESEVIHSTEVGGTRSESEIVGSVGVEATRSESEVVNSTEIAITQNEPDCPALIKKLFPAGAQNVALLLTELDNEVVSEINMFIFTVPINNVKKLALSLTMDTARYLQLLGDNQYKISIAKCYAVYSWISTHMSVNMAMQRSEVNSNYDCDIESILADGNSTSYGFALLFYAICEEAGISVEIVKGNIKGWQSTTGEIFRPTTGNVHFWNVVKFKNKPYIFDAMMGSGYISFSLKFIKEFNAHYFGVPANYSILSHWPENSSQQYLETPILLDEFTPLVAVDVATLSVGLVPSHWYETICVSGADPHTSVTLKLPHDKPIIQAILQPTAQEYNMTKFHNLVFVEKLEDNYCWQIHVVLPSAGRFILNIFLQNFCFENKTYLSYIINCDCDPHDKIIGYPLIFPMSAYSFKFKLIDWNKNNKAYICKHSCKTPCSMNFTGDAGLLFHHCIVKGQHLTLENMEQDEILIFNSKIKCDKNGCYQLSVIFPSAGWWTVHLSAGQQCDDNTVSGYTKLLSYCIYAEEGNEEQSYPYIFNTNLVQFNSDPVSSPSGVPLQISFESCLSKWICSVTNSAGNSTGYAVVNVIDRTRNLFKLIAVFPMPGIWSVLVHGRSLSEKSYIAVFKLQLSITEGLPNTYLINCLEEASIYEMKFPGSNLILFEDNGKPFSCSFTASPEVNFISTLKEQDGDPINFGTFLNRNTELSEYTIFAIFPKHGKWIIEIFAKLSSMENYDLVAVINLSVSHPSPNYCYPKLQPFFYDAGLRLNEEDALLPRQSATRNFRLPFKGPINAMFLCSMSHEHHPEDPQLAFVQPKNTSGDLCLYAVFPELGEWNISMFAKVPDNTSDSAHFTEVLQILVTNSAIASQHSFPQIFEGFYKFKIHFADEDIPLPSVVNLTLKLEHVVIKFYCPRRVSFLHYSTIVNPDKSNNNSETRRMTTMVSNPDTRAYTIEVNVDAVGEWIVYLFAENKEKVNAWIPVLKYRFTAQQYQNIILKS